MEIIYSNINLDNIKYDIDSVKSYENNSITVDRDHVLEAFVNTTPGSHNLIVYSDMRILRRIYPVYIKSLLERGEIVLILTHYDSPSKMREMMLLNADNKQYNALHLEGYIHDGSLVIVDSLKLYSDSGHKDGTDKDNKLNFLSLIRRLLNRAIKNNKKGITIFSDMGSFFHFYSMPYKYNNNDFSSGVVSRILEYERSIPSSYKDVELKQFCLYHQKDYESYFTSTRQKMHLVDCHGRSVTIIDKSNRNDNILN